MQHLTPAGDPGYDLDAFQEEAGRMRLYGGGGGKGAKPPSQPAPTVMPTPDDSAMKRAKRNEIARLMERGGRQSTILTDGGGDKLGGG
jgi:hypothetical protein